MSNVFNFLGADATAFMKSSLQVFNNLSGSMQYVGKTKPEVDINPNMGVAEWWDNSSGTQTLFVVDPDKVDPKIGFSFAQVLDENALALFLHGQIDRTVPGQVKVYQGSNPGSFEEAMWQFVGRGRTGRVITYTVLRGIVIPTGSFKPGTPGAYADLGITVRALQDTTVANTGRDLAYWTINSAASS